MRTETTLYRFYAKDGSLLYVGVTDHIFRRVGDHAHSKEWFNEIQSAKFKHYPTRRQALSVEAKATRLLHPKYSRTWQQIGQQRREERKASHDRGEWCRFSNCRQCKDSGRVIKYRVRKQTKQEDET